MSKIRISAGVCVCVIPVITSTESAVDFFLEIQPLLTVNSQLTASPSYKNIHAFRKPSTYYLYRIFLNMQGC